LLKPQRKWKDTAGPGKKKPNFLQSQKQGILTAPPKGFGGNKAGHNTRGKKDVQLELKKSEALHLDLPLVIG